MNGSSNFDGSNIKDVLLNDRLFVQKRISPSFSPRSINEVRFRDRAQSEYDDEVRVTVAVPSAEENKALFSANLAIKEIQPIWVKVENHSDRKYFFISAATDPNYYSPNETSFTVHGGLSQSDQKELENHKVFSFRQALPIFACKLTVRIRSPSGSGAPETAPQHPRKKPLAPMVQPDAF
jgi:hypothetical protein